MGGARRLEREVFWEGLRASPEESFSALNSPGLALMWPGSGFSGFYIVWTFSKKQTPLLEKGSTVRTVALSAGSFSKKTNHLVFLFMRKSPWEKLFFCSLAFFFGVRGEREREGTHKKKSEGIENRTF